LHPARTGVRSAGNDSAEIETLRGYLDAATAGASDNTYFEVDAQQAMGLPERAAARA
jgi:hypothetical protein